MDEFGVLVESIGFKAQGKSAPMANLKRKTGSSNGFPRDIGVDLGVNTIPPKSSFNSNPINGSFVDDLDGIFVSNNMRNRDGFDGLDDVFGGRASNSKASGGASGFDLDSVFKGSRKSGSSSSISGLYEDSDDIFGGIPGLKSSSANMGSSSSVSGLYDDGDDIFGGMQGVKSFSGNHDNGFVSMASPPKHNDSVDDLLGSFSGMGMNSNDSRRNSWNSSDVDGLIPGFGGGSPSSNGATKPSHFHHSNGKPSKSTSTSAEDPFGMFESSSSRNGTENGRTETNHFHQSKLTSTSLEDPFGMFESSPSSSSDPSRNGTDLESFFSMDAKANSAPKQKSTAEDPMFDILFQKKGGSKVEQKSASETAASRPSRKKAAPIPNFDLDFASVFGEAASSGQFREIEGESEERRRARLNNHMRTQARMAKALAEKNQRDFQTQHEQEERHRLAEGLDDDIKRWAAGKEGNLRALLSSLQSVLWAECGWQPVGLTDLITSVSVKKVYYKATLCVHPDKVQQKGATLQQKYIAEKVFDLLKEAWNKFNSEELR